MRKGWLLASFGVSLLVVGCGGSSGGGTGGSGGHAGSGGSHTGGSGGHAGSVGTGGTAGGVGGTGGTAGAAGGHAGTGGSGGAAGGTAGAAGGHAGSGGTAGAAGGHAGTGGSGGAAGGTAGAAGGHAGTGGTAGAAGGAAGGTAGSAGGAGGLAECGTSTMTSEGILCNGLEATGPCVTVTSSMAAVPAQTGGNIQPGTYDLVSAVAHYAADAAVPTLLNPIRKTAVIAAGGGAGALMVDQAELSGSFLNRFSGTVTTSGSTLTFTQSCPQVDAGAGANSAYTFTSATGMLVVISDQGHGTMMVETWQKR